MFDGPVKYSPHVVSTSQSGCSGIISSGAIFSFYYYQKDGSLRIDYGHAQFNNEKRIMIMYDEGKRDFISKSEVFANERAVIKLFGSDKQGFVSSKARNERVVVPVLQIYKIVFSGLVSLMLVEVNYVNMEACL